MNNLRQRVEDAFDLSTAEPAWLEVYETACATGDLIAELEALVRSDGLVTTGSKGQVAINPAVTELRFQRAAYAKLVAQLGLPEKRNHHAQKPGWAQ